jgi:hypothetical protein
LTVDVVSTAALRDLGIPGSLSDAMGTAREAPFLRPQNAGGSSRPPIGSICVSVIFGASIASTFPTQKIWRNPQLLQSHQLAILKGASTSTE